MFCFISFLNGFTVSRDIIDPPGVISLPSVIQVADTETISFFIRNNQMINLSKYFFRPNVLLYSDDDFDNDRCRLRIPCVTFPAEYI